MTTVIAEAGEDTGSSGGSDTQSGGGDYPLSLTSGADNETFTDDEAEVYALAGNDTLKISGNYGYYDGGAGNDKLSLDGGAEGNTLTGGAGNDTLYTNGLGNVILYSGGKDVIHGFGENDSLVIDGTVTKTSQSGANVLITVGSASNVITIKDVALGNLDTTGGALTYTDEIIDEPEPDYPVSLTASADKETFSDEGATVYALNGNDTIENAGGESYINGGNGNDLLINTANNVTLEGAAGSDRLSLSADASGNVFIGGAGNDSIFTNGAGNLIRYSAGSGKDAVFGFAGDDSIEVDGTISKVAQSGANVLVTVGSSSNVITIKNTALGNISVDGGVITYTEEALPDYPKSLTSGADSLEVSDDEAEVYALAGNDTLKISGNYGYFDGGAGNDKLSLDGGAEGNTLAGGAGNDTIYTNGLGNVIQYSGGKDVILGFGENDSIEINGTISKIAQSGANVLVTVGSSANVITIKDFALGNVDTTGGVITYTEEILPEYPMSLTSGKDSLEVSDDEAEVYALAGNDSLTITGNDGYFDGGAGNDRISLGGDATGNTIYGGAGVDTIYMNGAGNVIQYSTGDGKDVIVGFGENDSVELDGEVTKIAQSGVNVLVTVGSSANVLTFKNFSTKNLYVEDNVIAYTEEILPEYPLSLTSGADSLTVSDDDATVYGLAGKDTITSEGSFSYISGGAGNDILINGGEEVTLAGDAGADTIYTNGFSNLIQYSASGGKDVIIGFSDTDSIEITGTIRSSVQSGANVIVYVGTGTSNSITLKDISLNNLSLEDSVITFREGAVPINLTAKADNYSNAEDDATVDALAGNDTLSNSGSYVSINGGTGNDSIKNTGNLVTLDGGAGNDTIISDGDTALIDAGAGTDRISLGNDAGNVTISGGAGNDTIYSNGSSNLIQFGSGDGKDVIFGFSGEDSIQITSGSVSRSVQSGANVLVTVGSSSNVLTIRDVQIGKLAVEDNIISAFDMTKYLTEKADTTLISDSNIYVDALAGADKITLTGSEVTISGNAGNDTD